MFTVMSSVPSGAGNAILNDRTREIQIQLRGKRGNDRSGISRREGEKIRKDALPSH